MAQVTEVRLVDDRDKGPADETVQFGLDGRNYTIDLSSNNAQALRESIQEWLEFARPDSNRPAPQRQQATGRSRGRGDSQRLNEIRAWAKENGHSVADRGRISKAVQDAYAAAH